LNLVLAAHPNKNIAADLHMSQRTVDNHRAAIARKTCSKSLPTLIQTALSAGCSVHAQSEPQLAARWDGAGEQYEYNPTLDPKSSARLSSIVLGAHALVRVLGVQSSNTMPTSP
jgi:hypothetical protein